MARATSGARCQRWNPAAAAADSIDSASQPSESGTNRSFFQITCGRRWGRAIIVLLGFQGQALDFVDEFLDVPELPVNRRKAHISHFVETPQVLHDLVADRFGWNFI